MVKTEDLQKAGSMCAWAGCGATFDGRMPDDWRWMLVYWWPYPAVNHTVARIATSNNCDRNCALCPEHALYLQSQLVDLMR